MTLCLGFRTRCTGYLVPVRVHVHTYQVPGMIRPASWRVESVVGRVDCAVDWNGRETTTSLLNSTSSKYRLYDVVFAPLLGPQEFEMVHQCLILLCSYYEKWINN